MTQINRLSAVYTLSAGDQLVIWSPAQGDARRSSLTVLRDFLKAFFETFTVSSYIMVQPCLVSDLPAGVAGARAFVTNATATTFASVVAGGGANSVPVYHDGTNWRIG